MMEIDYYDYEEVIKHFWRCSIKQDFSSFDWEQAFDNLSGEIKRKLAEHGFLGYDEYVENEEGMGMWDKNDLNTFTNSTDYIQITEDDLIEAILKYKYQRFKVTFEDYSTFQDLHKLYNEIEAISVDDAEQKDLVILFDKLIHAEHETGLILDIDIEELRKEVEV